MEWKNVAFCGVELNGVKECSILWSGTQWSERM